MHHGRDASREERNAVGVLQVLHIAPHSRSVRLCRHGTVHHGDVDAGLFPHFSVLQHACDATASGLASPGILVERRAVHLANGSADRVLGLADNLRKGAQRTGETTFTCFLSRALHAPRLGVCAPSTAGAATLGAGRQTRSSPGGTTTNPTTYPLKLALHRVLVIDPSTKKRVRHRVDVILLLDADGSGPNAAWPRGDGNARISRNAGRRRLCGAGQGNALHIVQPPLQYNVM